MRQSHFSASLSGIMRSDLDHLPITKQRAGIALHEMKGAKPLTEPKPLSPEEAQRIAQEHYERWFPRIEDARRTAEFCVNDGNLNDAAFMLHQATERAYDCLLLVLTNYAPATHNIKCPRSLAESHEPRLIDVRPRESKHDRRCFELLKRAYVEARYSEHYKITSEEFVWLCNRIEQQRALIESICKNWLKNLRRRPMGTYTFLEK